jgi:hypothetical protein
MRRSLFYILSLIILITCTKDVFEEETVTVGDPDSQLLIYDYYITNIKIVLYVKSHHIYKEFGLCKWMN